ncbi:MAG TPA: D-sedoheptulose 7-phosphate isomerase [Steroidobacteraceae bacterium]|nr:D-sedoheptulose 7-phosphate isomerase [Steroidobacteraceae bacterium]
MPGQLATARDPDAELDAFLSAEAAEHRESFESCMAGLRAPFAQTLSLWEASIRRGGKLLIFGNGGSAGNAQHIAAELVIRYKTDRAAIAAVALTVDVSTLTAAGNDMGFDAVFSRQVQGLGRPGDVAVGISTSGRSPNVLAALQEARRRNLATTGLIGGDGGPMRALCDAAIVVPSTVTARVQEMHLLVSHMLCKALEIRLGLVKAHT